jgi:hypothetical protein
MFETMQLTMQLIPNKPMGNILLILAAGFIKITTFKILNFTAMGHIARQHFSSLLSSFEILCTSNSII